MYNLPHELTKKILSNIPIQTGIRYIPFGDGEQNYTIFYKKIYPYIFVNKAWFIFYNHQSRL